MERPENKTRASQPILRNCCFVGLTTLLVTHFLMTLAVTLPPTPLSVEYSRKIDGWIYPYFIQNWSFFAPDPPTEDAYVIAQYRYKSGDGTIAESSWINLSRTFNQAVQRNRLSPLEIVQVTLLNASGDLVRSEIFKDGRLDEPAAASAPYTGTDRHELLPGRGHSRRADGGSHWFAVPSVSALHTPR